MTTMHDARIKGVIFDWAGTIVDHGCFGPVVAFQEVFERAGVPISIAEARAPMGLPKKEHLRTIAAMPLVMTRWEERHGKAFRESDIEDLYAAFTGMQISVLKDHCGVIEGTTGVLAGLRERRVRIGSTTGYVRAMMNEVIPRADKQGLHIDSVVCADDVPSGRPYPWMAFRVMEQIGVFPPHACVKVGDTLPDVAEGRNAGMWTVAVIETGSDLGMTEQEVRALGAGELRSRSTDIGRTLSAAGAHFVIPTVRDLPAVIEVIEGRLGRGDRP